MPVLLSEFAEQIQAEARETDEFFCQDRDQRPWRGGAT
jgi:hypothetical protein